MKMIYNLILDEAGYKPITDDDLSSVCALSWHNWVDTDRWIAPDGREVTRKAALQEVELTNK